MSDERNWDYVGLADEHSINNSKKTIKLFERSISNAQERNESSYVKIAEWQKEFDEKNEEFFNINGIYFDEAQEYIDRSNNPDEEFNLESFNVLKDLRDKINGEKFFVNQREKQIEKNIKVIENILTWIEAQEQNK